MPRSDTERKGKRRLKRLTLSRVDFVPRGSNPGAHIKIVKEDKTASEPGKKVTKVDSDTRTVEELRAEIRKMGERLDRLVSKGAVGPAAATAEERLEKVETKLAKAAKERVAEGRSPTVEQAKVAVMHEDAELRAEYRKAAEPERPEPAPHPFGALVVAKRRAAGLTQVELSRAVDLSQTGLSYIERGGRPDPQTMGKLYDALDLSLAEMKAVGIYSGRVV